MTSSPPSNDAPSNDAPSRDAPSDSSRPQGHYDAPEQIQQPRLSFVGYLRYFWRQLTSMRTALFLLLLLAIAAIPGSLVPQVSSDPNGVIQFKQNNPDVAPILDNLQVFATYSSVWFSAIYLLLFISLIGCVIPRTKHHFDALRARPPKTPARLARLEGFAARSAPGETAVAIASAGALLKKAGYRTEVYGNSVSAERGYLRETGNLVFHTALIGVLVTVGIGGGFGYTGQRVVVEGYSMTNTLASYDSFNPGRFFTDAALQPYSIAVDSFVPTYEIENTRALGQAIDYVANVTTTLRGADPQNATIKVNEPLHIGDTDVFLLGNGYAPVVTIKDPAGNTIFSQPTACLPQDTNLTSNCIIKLPDGLAEQVGMIGFFYPTALQLADGTLASTYPDTINPVISLFVYTGDLGLDNGAGSNAYSLSLDNLTQIAGTKAAVPAIKLAPGDSADLPNGLGTIEFTSVPRFVSLDVHHDPAQLWVLVFAALVVAGLVTSLFIPRRRVWVKVVSEKDGILALEYAGLARGDDPGLDTAVAELADRHLDQLGLKVDQ